MKTSRRLLFGTFIVALVAPVALVAFSRINGGSISERPAPERTPAAELAMLRDFTAIDIRSDSNFEIVSAADYSIAYTPLFETRGNFTARVQDGTLFIEGYGNRSNPDFDAGTPANASTVRISLPELVRVVTESQQSLAIRNFDTDTLEVRVGFAERGAIALENNRLSTLRLVLGPTQNVQLRGNTITNTEISHFGLTISTD